MKKLLITCMILTLSTVGFAQDKNKKEKIKVDFYGVDFRAVNVVGAEETSEQFMDAFERINGILIAEQSKYDVAKYLGLDVLSTSCDMAVKQLDKLKAMKFKDREQSDIDIHNMVSNYPGGENKGLVIIAKELNKKTNVGTFIAVIYDGKSKEVLSQQEFSGKSGGFGLRNYWAGALHDGLKSAKSAGHNYSDDLYR